MLKGAWTLRDDSLERIGWIMWGRCPSSIACVGGSFVELYSWTWWCGDDVGQFRLLLSLLVVVEKGDHNIIQGNSVTLYLGYLASALSDLGRPKIYGALFLSLMLRQCKMRQNSSRQPLLLGNLNHFNNTHVIDEDADLQLPWWIDEIRLTKLWESGPHLSPFGVAVNVACGNY